MIREDQELRYLKQWKQDGNWRIRFRRDGYKEVELKPPPGYRGDKSTLSNSRDFLTAYLAAGSQAVAEIAPGEKRAAYGTVSWLVIEYFASLDFTGRPKSIQKMHRRYLEQFRTQHGDKLVSVKRGDIIVPIINHVMVEKWFAKLIDTPIKANAWVSAMRDLFRYAIKIGLLTGNPAAEIKRRKAKIHIGEDGETEEGHLTWPVKVVTMAREKFPVGTEMRLAIEMINALAFRRSDAVRVGLPQTYAGTLEDGRPATFLKYTQHKNRERKPVVVDTPIPSELLAVIKATTATGLKTWLISKRGVPFTEQAFTDWFTDRMAEAGMPMKYTPHGLRKRCLTRSRQPGQDYPPDHGHLRSPEREGGGKVHPDGRPGAQCLRRDGRAGLERERKSVTL